MRQTAPLLGEEVAPAVQSFVARAAAAAAAAAEGEALLNAVADLPALVDLEVRVYL